MKEERSAAFNLKKRRPESGAIAHNRCTACEHEWHDRPFGRARQPSCPRCGSVYWKWLDYEGE